MASLVQQVSVKIPIKEELPKSRSIPIPTNISRLKNRLARFSNISSEIEN